MRLKVTLVRSPLGRKPSHRATVEALGLRRIRQSVVHESTDSIRGMVRKVDYLLNVEELG